MICHDTFMFDSNSIQFNTFLRLIATYVNKTPDMIPTHSKSCVSWLETDFALRSAVKTNVSESVNYHSSFISFLWARV